ncbi:MAG TPA: FAD-dependent monooxygenase [Verrucomicrobiae bacterium]|nr:FAD-dependent monooxygenase [Verrucomicrobiae bacterium]
MKVETKKHAVVIAGGGPTGLMLAAELKLAGVDVVIVERRADQHLDESRAKGIHARAVEVLDQRGVAERFISAGQSYPNIGFAGARLDISDFPTRHNYLLGISQSKFEPILADWAEELGVPIMRSSEVTNFTQDDHGVTIKVSDGQSLRADYLVGCDGGQSLVRKVAGIDFPGLDASVSYIIAEVKMSETPAFGMRPEGGGIGPSADGKSIGVTIREKVVKHGDRPSMEELREALVSTYETDYGLTAVNWVSRFSDATRQAATYRKGRILLAGDAAHIHPPQGGQGLGTGLQDAVNLGWKLAQVVNKTSPGKLLDSYHAERHPVGARVLQNTRAQIVLSKPDGQHVATHEIMTELLDMDEPRKHVVGMLSALDIHYDLGEGYPLLGRRMPDLDLVVADGPTRLFSLLHDAKAVLLNLGGADEFDVSAWSGRVKLINATYKGTWELPVLGEITAASAALIRPDGYVAWTGNIADPELPQALTTWFGGVEKA